MIFLAKWSCLVAMEISERFKHFFMSWLRSCDWLDSTIFGIEKSRINVHSILIIISNWTNEQTFYSTFKDSSGHLTDMNNCPIWILGYIIHQWALRDSSQSCCNANKAENYFSPSWFGLLSHTQKNWMRREASHISNFGEYVSNLCQSKGNEKHDCKGLTHKP